jgi:hypothetical protein
MELTYHKQACFSDKAKVNNRIPDPLIESRMRTFLKKTNRGTHKNILIWHIPAQQVKDAIHALSL